MSEVYHERQLEMVAGLKFDAETRLAFSGLAVEMSNFGDAGDFSGHSHQAVVFFLDSASAVACLTQIF